MRFRVLFFLLPFGFLVSAPAFAQINVGEEAPDFTYTAFETGATYSLSDFRGKIVYMFFFGANCGHCRANGPVTETEIYNRFKSNSKFVALGLQVWQRQTEANVSAFKQITGITYPILLEARESMNDYYGHTSAYDRSLVVGDDGTLIYKGNINVNNDYEEVVGAIEQALESIEVSSETEPDNPFQFKLEQNYPNPFNPSTVIRYQLAANSMATLEIFDLMGRNVASLVDNEFQQAGEYTVQWDASAVPSGIYLYRLSTQNMQLTRKMTLIK